MSSDRTVVEYLKDILDGIEKAKGFIEGLDYDGFVKDEKTSFAVVRALEIIGEAAKQIPDTIRSQYPDAPWREMAGTRDVLMHRYFGINYRVVWKTVREDLPKLKPVITEILAKQEEPDQKDDEM
jgi:uncharacterized protein with HEPN domain